MAGGLVAGGMVSDPPEMARRVFGARLELAAAYVELLVTTGIDHGLVGPREAPRMWERHVVNCALAAPAFQPDAEVADLGTGAGLPGLVLAIARPDLRLHLIEPLHRRIVWLERTVELLALENVVLLEGRAEVYAGRLAVRHTTARAVARLDALSRWSAPLLAPGGSLVALKGSGAAAELAADWPAMRRAGARAARVCGYGESGLLWSSSVAQDDPPKSNAPFDGAGVGAGAEAGAPAGSDKPVTDEGSGDDVTRVVIVDFVHGPAPSARQERTRGQSRPTSKRGRSRSGGDRPRRARGR